MREADLESAERAANEAFLEGDRLTRRVSDPEPQPRSDADSVRWIERMRFFLSVDPGGCWVAVDGDRVVGFAISQNRDRLWYLATYGVLPGCQGSGIGRKLMDAVLAHAGERSGMLISTVHPAATRRYRLAGFLLHPLMRMVGTVDRSALPQVTGLREGEVSDLEWMDRLDVQLRGAGHGPDHEYMVNTLRLLVSSVNRRPGYVYVNEHGGPALLAAAQEDTARSLLWEALAASPADTLVNCITAGNHWAIDVGLEARLDIGQEGYLAVRGIGDPAPYLASGHFL
jgi:GNAT superfamily N-acetyltransferase